MTCARQGRDVPGLLAVGELERYAGWGHSLTLARNDMRKDGRDAPVLLAVGKLERYADWGAVSINRRRYQDGVSQV